MLNRARRGDLAARNFGASSLKTDRMSGRQFPRSQERGPIEANPLYSEIADQGVFPRSQERGPIEAYTSPSCLSPKGQFPRSQERGPIEAIAETVCSWSDGAISALSGARPH